MVKSDFKDLTDSEIIKRVINGEPDMFAGIVERYEAKLLNYAIYLVRDYDIASDLVQESFINSYIKLNSFNLSKDFSPWVYRILHNEAMNFFKKSKRIVSINAVDELKDNHINRFVTDKKIDQAITKQNVTKCLKQLDIKYREVIVLYYLEGLKYNQIGEILHVPVSTVGVRIKRGKILLKTICQNNGVDYDWKE